METAPQPEKIAPQEKIASEAYKGLVLRLFKNFRERPDQPKYSYEEQHLLADESAKAEALSQKEKTEEAKDLSEQAKRKFLESKEDKKHISTLWTPLAAAKYYLESEDSEFIPKEKREELIGKIENLYVDMEIAREQQNISDELVTKVLSAMDEIEINFK